MEAVKLLIKHIDTFNKWIGYIFSWILVVLMLFTVLEVIMRRFLGAPTIWSFETCTHLYGMHFMITAAYTLQSKSHVTVDILYAKLRKKKQAILDVIGYVLFFYPFCFVMFWYGIKFARASWSTWETSWSVFAIPLYPLKTVIPVTAALLLLQGTAIFVERLYFCFTGKELANA